MREELTEAVVRGRSEKRRSQKSHKTNRKTLAPEPPYQQSHRPKVCSSIKNGDPSTGIPQRTPRNPPKQPLDRTSPVADSELKHIDNLIKKIYETKEKFIDFNQITRKTNRNRNLCIHTHTYKHIYCEEIFICLKAYLNYQYLITFLYL